MRLKSILFSAGLAGFALLRGAPLELGMRLERFIDANPAAVPAEKYKAHGGARGGLYALASADGIHWRLLREAPAFTEGLFDSQNVPFGSAAEQCYVLDYRIWGDGFREGGALDGVRTTVRTTSRDFIRWTKPERMTFGDRPLGQRYTIQTFPYYRAPRIYLAFAMRLVPKRQLLSMEVARARGVFPNREKRISDGVFLISRGCTVYVRTFRRAYFRPGPDRRMWVVRNSITALGVVALGGCRLGTYRQHHCASPTNHLELYSEREDGIARLHAGAKEGDAVTLPFVVAGREVRLNFATSAVGAVRVAALDEAGTAFPGCAGAHAPEMFADSVAGPVRWTGRRIRADLADRTVRLRFVIRNADLLRCSSTDHPAPVARLATRAAHRYLFSALL